MNKEQSEKILEDLKLLQSTIDPKVSKKLELAKWERVLKRLDSFSLDCEECTHLLITYEDHINQLKGKSQLLEKPDFIEHKNTMANFISHLQRAQVNQRRNKPKYLYVYRFKFGGGLWPSFLG